VDNDERIEKTLGIMKEVEKRVEDFEAGFVSKETFKGEVGALIETAMTNERERQAEERTRELDFAAPEMPGGGDLCVRHLSAVERATTVNDRNEAAAYALTFPSGNANVERLKEVNDDLAIAHAYLTVARANGKATNYRGMESLPMWDEFKELRDAVHGSVRTPMSTGGEGADWIPTGMSSSVIKLENLEGEIEGLFAHVNMPTNPYVDPLIATGIAVLPTIVTEQTGLTNPADEVNQSLVDGKTTYTAVPTRSRVITSMILNEDSIFDVIGEIKTELRTMQFRGVETCILNGDKTSTHQDSDTHALGATDVRKVNYGLRYLALNSNSGAYASSINTFTYENVIGIRKTMGKYGAKPGNLAWICGAETFIDLLVLKDAGSNLVMKTDNLGAILPSTPGAVGSIAGSGVVVSEHMREDLNASGVFDDTTETQTAILCVNKKGFKVGDRRAITLAGEYWATSDQMNLVAFRRWDFEPVFKTSAAELGTYANVAIGYNKTT